ncbi:hypothetical protein HO173_012879 [Letharia columbiana]|uniref:Uncharacterized protein n=1 Tax=Letharia columbiana TaxID=112416 RepID=A0A8H6FDT6_9LECA|nr:uncharacterized protein HO173_012879 [Letharia columbiana]KAF6224690.1 hypothetical protein HO173_012879 [Letharia columbiana]
MAYQASPGAGGYEEDHRLHDLPSGSQYHLPPHEGSDDEDERALLAHGQGPFNGPFDEPHSGIATPLSDLLRTTL